MGRAGPPKRPTALREYENDKNLKYEKPRNEPKPVADNLDPPPHLFGTALEKWHELREVLEPVGLMTEADKDSLATYCVNWQLLLICLENINKDGMVMEFDGGNGKNYRQTSPHTVTMLKLQAALVKTSKEFGLTPSARASLDLGDKEPVDPLDEFVIKKAQ